MAEPKKNKDGLVGGSLVSPKEHAKLTLEKRKKPQKQTKKLEG